jgi:hypothetical protein
MNIPSNGNEIRAWVERLGLSDSEAATALGLGNPHCIIREFRSEKREPSQSTRVHMDLLEQVIVAFGALLSNNTALAKITLQDALEERFGRNGGIVLVRFDPANHGTNDDQPQARE